MDSKLVRVQAIQERYTSTGKLSSYSIQCFHDGLREHRELKSSEIEVLHHKVDSLLERWDEKWKRQQSRQAKQNNADSASDATEDAQEKLERCQTLLSHSLGIDDRVNWETLKQHKHFHWDIEQSPALMYARASNEPLKIRSITRPEVPLRNQLNFTPKFQWYDFLLPFLKRRKVEESEQLFASAHLSYTKAVSDIEKQEQERKNTLAAQQRDYLTAKSAYDSHCQTVNNKVDAWQSAWRKLDPDATVEHAELVLNASDYPDWFERDFDVNYVADTKLLVVDYQLPSPASIPSLERVTYIKSRDELVEKHITEVRARKLFDEICYQVTLRTLHELFEADEPNALQSIAFNGWVEAANRSTGIVERSCILSLHVQKNDFLNLDLDHVDPKTCFKALKGVSASSLHQIAPIRPVIQLQRDDPRFIDSYAVADSLDESVNLAAMNWEDFEHLVRELFGKAFGKNGATVHVTQASRDGGVDAIALDPDPLRGGKIVIQAKRYTATVSVSAVRDLYGTVMNEGANRGILVTTSDYGPDAYKFAAGKPITLLNGANLLALLAEHGHKARIDVNEARLI